MKKNEKPIEDMTAQEYFEQRNKRFRDTVNKKYGKDHWKKAGKTGAEKRWSNYRKEQVIKKQLDKEIKEVA